MYRYFMVLLVLLAACSVDNTRTEEDAANSLTHHLLNPVAILNTDPEPVLTRDVRAAARRGGQKNRVSKRRRHNEPFLASFGPPRVNTNPFEPSDPDVHASSYDLPERSGVHPGEVQVVSWPPPDETYGNLFATGPWFLRPQFNVYNTPSKRGRARHPQQIHGGFPKRRGGSARGPEHGFHSVVNYGVVNIHHASHHEPHHNGQLPQSPPPPSTTTTQEPFLSGVGSGSGVVQAALEQTVTDAEDESEITETKTQVVFTGNIEENAQTEIEKTRPYDPEYPDYIPEEVDENKSEPSSTAVKIMTDSSAESTPTTERPEQKENPMNSKTVANAKVALNHTQLSVDPREEVSAEVAGNHTQLSVESREGEEKDGAEDTFYDTSYDDVK